MGSTDRYSPSTRNSPSVVSGALLTINWFYRDKRPSTSANELSHDKVKEIKEIKENREFREFKGHP